MKHVSAIVAGIALVTLLHLMHHKTSSLEQRIQRLESFCDHQIDINRMLLTNREPPIIFTLDAE